MHASEELLTNRHGLTPWRFSFVPSMFDSSGVKVLSATRWKESHSEAQGRSETGVSEKSVEQTSEPMDELFPRCWPIALSNFLSKRGVAAQTMLPLHPFFSGKADNRECGRSFEGFPLSYS